MVTHMQSDHGPTVTFNVENMAITCSYRKYESIGMYTYFESWYIVYTTNWSMNNGIHTYQVYYASMPSKNQLK
jgi:hypothetical protein